MPVRMSSNAVSLNLKRNHFLALEAGAGAWQEILSLAGFAVAGARIPAVAGRVPPGQYVTPDFPVLSAGPTPRTPLAQWDFAIRGAVQPSRRWTWDEFRALPSETVTVDIHCVTKWSKLDTVWEGVAVDTLLDGVETDGAYVTAF